MGGNMTALDFGDWFNLYKIIFFLGFMKLDDWGLISEQKLF